MDLYVLLSKIEMDVSNWGAALISNFFPMNPVNESLPQGVAFAFFDQLLINHTLVTGNITMTITLPTSIVLNSVLFIFYAFNMSGTLKWDAAPPEFYQYGVSYNYLTNSITIEMPAYFLANGIISAMAYFSEEFPPEIPGYDIFLISMLLIITSAVLLKTKRKRL